MSIFLKNIDMTHICVDAIDMTVSDELEGFLEACRYVSTVLQELNLCSNVPTLFELVRVIR